MQEVITTFLRVISLKETGSMAEIPLAVVLRIMKVAGAERANRKAVKMIAEKAEDYGGGVAVEAIKLTKLAERKTISGNDIRLAAERVNRR